MNHFSVEDDDPSGKAKIYREERISNYLRMYGIDSAEYAIIRDGEIIISENSAVYKIQHITNLGE